MILFMTPCVYNLTWWILRSLNGSSNLFPNHHHNGQTLMWIKNIHKEAMIHEMLVDLILWHIFSLLNKSGMVS